MSTATLPAEPMLTLPRLSIRLGIGIDRIRRRFRSDPELRALAVAIGPALCVREQDIDAVRAKLARGA